MTRDEYLNDCIKKDMIALKFMENNQLTTFTDINLRVKSLCEKRDECYKNIIRIQENLIEANEVKVAIEAVRNIRKSMENNATNPDYVLYEKENDLAMINMYERFLKGYDIRSLEEEQKWIMLYNQHKEKLENLTNIMESIDKRLKKYDDCVNNIRRINSEYHVFDRSLSLYDEIKQDFAISNNTIYHDNNMEKTRETEEKNKPNIYE